MMLLDQHNPLKVHHFNHVDGKLFYSQAISGQVVSTTLARDTGYAKLYMEEHAKHAKQRNKRSFRQRLQVRVCFKQYYTDTWWA